MSDYASPIRPTRNYPGPEPQRALALTWTCPALWTFEISYGRLPTLASSDGDLSMTDYDQELDACGLNCPLPILRAKKALTKMGSGEVLRIIATDPGSVKDFEAFSRQTGNELLESIEDGGKFYYRMKKA